uniref:Uncharacterized protein n=1 Tax=Timema tahoe TaxID=61484 RepID=A0A7R9FNT6_9NEOP|nr:unnamed protein product [Timema tahoe]
MNMEYLVAGDINVSDISSDDSFGWRPVKREVDVSLVACEMKMSSSDSSEIPTNSNRSISVNTNLSKTDHNLSPSESSNYDSDDVNKTRKRPSLQTTAELRTRQLENVKTMNKHLKVEPHETSSDEDLGEKNHANISTAVKILNSSNRSMLSHPNWHKNKPKHKAPREPVLLSKVSELNVEQFELDYKAPMLWCEELTDDNDVWLVQCPNTIEPECLVNQRFSLSGVTELSVNPGQQLQVSSFHRHSEPLTCVLPSNKNLSFTTGQATSSPIKVIGAKSHIHCMLVRSDNDVPGCQRDSLVDLPHTIAQALKLVMYGHGNGCTAEWLRFIWLLSLVAKEMA